MSKSALLLAGLFALFSTPVFAQVVVTSRPVVTYYSPAYYAPSYYSHSSRVVYDAPVTVSRPVTTYYAPLAEGVPVTSYYAPTYTVRPTTTYYAPTTTYYDVPTTSYYAPVTTYYGGTVGTPMYSPSVNVGRSAYGTVRAYVPGQPVRNALRFSVP